MVSGGFSDKILKPFTTSNNSPSPAWNYISTKTWLKFHGSCKLTFKQKAIVNIYIVCKINLRPFK